jgi:hypothetical protein
VLTIDGFLALMELCSPSFPEKFGNAVKSKGAAGMAQGRVASRSCCLAEQYDRFCKHTWGYDRYNNNIPMFVDVKARRGDEDKEK